jgi:small subunit ribosomal protein S6
LRRYETIFILRPDLGESAQKDTIRRFEGIVASSGGEIIEVEEWGFRELAYNIKAERRGFYVRMDYGGDGATMNEVERNLKLSDQVLRYLSVLVDRDIEAAAVRAELEAHRHRAAEARAAAEAARLAAEAARAAAAEAAASGESEERAVDDLAADEPALNEEAPNELAEGSARPNEEPAEQSNGHDIAPASGESETPPERSNRDGENQ